MLDTFVEAALAPKVGMPLEVLGAMQHQSAWGDIVAKAKRLIQSGKVTILHNTANAVYGHVVGDHGEYETSISRTDPTTSIIEMWTCTCPWDQFAFQRTRKWKKYEGRVCSHVLATYWKAKSTPLDDGTEPTPDGEPPKPAPFQRTQPHTEEEAKDRQKQIDEWKKKMKEKGLNPEDFDFAPAQVTEGDADAGELPDNLPRSFGPQGDILDLPQQRQMLNDRAYQQPVPEQTVLPRQPSFPKVLPYRTGPMKPQRDHMQLFDVIPPQPGTEAQPGQPLPVSTPGGRPPTPGNPVGIPGALSHFIPVVAVRLSDFHYAVQDDFEQMVQDALRSSQRVTVQLRQPAMLEQRGGKIPMPTAQPLDTNEEGIATYRMLDMGYDPDTDMRVRADERPGGAPEQRGVYSEAPRGRRAEVTDIEPSMKMVHIQVPLNASGPLHPHYLAGWVSYTDVLALPESQSPFWKRR